MKPDFDKAQNAATSLLLHQTITGLFLDVRNFVLPSNIVIDSVQNFCSVTGFPASSLSSNHVEGAILLRQSGYNIVLYDENINNEARKHWGIVHELGHIFLNHVVDGEKEEKEAHFFTAQVVMPEIVLIDITKRQGGRLRCSDIYDNFNASYTASEKRIQTLQRRGCWNCGPSDLALLQKFSPFLDRVFGNKGIA